MHALFLLYVRTMIPHRISIEPWTVTPCIQNALYTCIYIYHTYVSTLCTIEPCYVILLGCVCVSKKCCMCWRLPGPKCIPHKMHNQGLEIIHAYVHIQLYIHLQIGTCTVQYSSCTIIHMCVHVLHWVNSFPALAAP